MNNKYNRPKYGRGIFSKYTPVLRHTERGSVKSNDGKIAIDRAIGKVVEPDKKKQVVKRKRAPAKKKTPDNVKKTRKTVANAKKRSNNNNNNNNNIDWGDRKLNDLIKNS